MQLPPNYTGLALAVFSTEDHKTPILDLVQISKGYYDTFAFSHKGKILSDTLDYETRLDTYQHQINIFPALKDEDFFSSTGPLARTV